MSGSLGRPGPRPGSFADRIGDRLDEVIAGALTAAEEGARRQKVIMRVPGTDTKSRARLAERLAAEHDVPVFRLAVQDLVAAPHVRMAAVLALLDAADVAGGIAMLDAADHLAPDPAAQVGLDERLQSSEGIVVLLSDRTGPTGLFAGVVDHDVQPD